MKDFRELLKDKPGIYVLHEGEDVFYVGRAGEKNGDKGCLYSRIKDHAHKYNDNYSHSWNYFSAYIITEEFRPMIEELEGILQLTCLGSSNRERGISSNQLLLPNSVNKVLKKSEYIQIEDLNLD